MKGEKNGCISDKKGAWKNMTKETDKISVIVPVYNVKNYLEDCVQSITHQTYPDLEILLIDDGSDDGSGRSVTDFSDGARMQGISRKT